MTDAVTIPVVESDRLILRAARLDDLDAFCTFMGDDRTRYIGGPLDRLGVWRLLMGGLGHWQLRGYGLWHAELKATGFPVGFAGVIHHVDWPEPELGYSVFADHEGTGLAYDMALTARNAARDLFGMTGLISLIHPDNARSQALATRLGAVHERDFTLRGNPCQIWRHPKEALS